MAKAGGSSGLDAVVFVCGAVLMALEIAGGRLLSADYGGTVYAWGSIIAVILCGLSVGYYFGGSLSDKNPSRSLLALVIAAAALLVAAIPFAYRQSVPLFSGISSVFAPLAAVMLFFLLPSVLLGMVSPFAIKLRAKSLGGIGGTAGNLYAVSTLGSVLGTFLTTFVLVLWLPLSAIFFGLSACLFLVALLLWAKKPVGPIVALAAIVAIILFFAAGIGIGFAGQNAAQVEYGNAAVFGENRAPNPLPQGEANFSAESLYGRVEVRDESNGVRGLYIDGGVMGEMLVADKFASVPAWEYFDFFEELALFAGAGEVLKLGVGAGIVPTRLSEKHGMGVDAVDINDKVLDAAQEYFGLSPGKNLRLFNEDARVFVKRAEKKYGLIIMDAFKYNRGTYSIPPHLTTQEFFREAKERLVENGVFAMMVVKKGSFLDSEYATLKSVFENVYVFNCGVYVLAASDSRIDFGQMPAVQGCAADNGIGRGAQVYTDDFAPVNELGGRQ